MFPELLQGTRLEFSHRDAFRVLIGKWRATGETGVSCYDPSARSRSNFLDSIFGINEEVKFKFFQDWVKLSITLGKNYAMISCGSLPESMGTSNLKN
jgi:hypothetical protein